MLDHICADVYVWFGELEQQGVMVRHGRQGLKVKKEAAEFYDNPSLEEAADVVISLLGACYSADWSLEDLTQAVRDKMVINRARTWEKQDDGTYQHVRVD
jgi:DNA-binding transcriptional regulator YhcF (GntR family)